MRKVKDPYRGYRKYMKAHCEICGNAKKYHPSELDAHHLIEQSEFKKNGQKIKHKGNIVTLCPNHHREVTIGKIIISCYRMSTIGLVIEYFYAKEPDKILYGY